MKLILDSETTRQKNPPTGKEFKVCPICNREFIANHNLRKYCSRKCYSRACYLQTRDKRLALAKTLNFKIKSRKYEKEHKYKTWETYCSYLVKKHRKRKRELSTEEVLKLLEKQNYKCALSGIDLTHTDGSIYNASIDRIEAGKTYNINNIQIICKCLNSFRMNIPVKQFIEICKKVSEYNI